MQRWKCIKQDMHERRGRAWPCPAKRYHRLVICWKPGLVIPALIVDWIFCSFRRCIFMQVSSATMGLLLLEDRVKPLSLRTAKLVFGHVRHVTYGAVIPSQEGTLSCACATSMLFKIIKYIPQRWSYCYWRTGSSHCPTSNKPVLSHVRQVTYDCRIRASFVQSGWKYVIHNHVPCPPY